MEDSQQFATLVRLALGQQGIEVDDVELAVIAAVEQVYGPARDALLQADLSNVMPEFGYFPGRRPDDLEGAETRPQ